MINASLLNELHKLFNIETNPEENSDIWIYLPTGAIYHYKVQEVKRVDRLDKSVYGISATYDETLVLSTCITTVLHIVSVQDCLLYKRCSDTAVAKNTACQVLCPVKSCVIGLTRKEVNMLYALYIVTATVMLLCLAFAHDMRVLRTHSVHMHFDQPASGAHIQLNSSVICLCSLYNASTFNYSS